MKMYFAVALSILTGAAIGGAAIQGLHAQAKPKAYSVTELEVVDVSAQAAYVPVIQAAQRTAGGRPLNTGGGKVVAMVGPPPSSVAIIEWDSLDQAQAFFNSAAFKDLDAQRAKANKTIRRFAVEATK